MLRLCVAAGHQRLMIGEGHEAGITLSNGSVALS
jgi:hypothetical protein